jgi:hypothetical protein
VVRGNPSTGTVRLTSPVPAGGLTVALSSSRTSRATVPSSVTVPAGSSTATFTVSTPSSASQGSVTITATLYGVAKTATLTVKRK